MRKYKILAYIVLIIIISVIAFIILKGGIKNNDENQKEKVISETKYLESKLVNLLNTMNNIKDKNYNISVSKIPEESKSSTNGGSASGNSSEGEISSGDQEKIVNSNSGGDTGGNFGQQSSNKSLNSESNNNQTSNEFTLKAGGVLTSKEDINWDIVKSGVENLYLSIPTITIDLYNQNVNQDEILAFNKEFDNLTIAAKEEKKVDTLTQLSKLYDYLPRFMQEDDELEQILVETKSNIFKAYSKLDAQNWTEISNDIKNATNIYSKILTNPDIDDNKQYSISKGYIMLNELQNAVNVKDTSVFLIKYKNLLEEINAIS